MPDAELKCLPLRTVTDGPLFGTKEGTLSDLTNMELQNGSRGMFAEARGGLDRMMPLGGTGANAITQGGYSWVHQVCTSTGWIRTFNSAGGGGAQYSANYQFHPGWYYPFQVGVAVTDAIYFGSDFPFSRIGVQVYNAATWTVTLVYEYWNGGSWTALTTDETIDFTAIGTKFATWRIPTDWATTTVGDAGTGNVLKYWMRIRVSVRTAMIIAPTVNTAFGIWNGMREIYEVNADPRTSGAGAILKRRGQSGTTEEWFTCGSSLFAGTQCPSRLTSYRGRTLLINGKDQKHWDGYSFRDLGLTPPGTGTVLSAVGGAAAGFGTRVTRVWIAFGYGPITMPDGGHPGQKFDAKPMYGWSQATYVGEQATTAGANERIRVDWTALTIGTNVSALGIYITDDLTGVTTNKTIYPAKLFDSLERAYFLNLFTIDLGSYGSPATEVLFPPQEAVIYDNTPPLRCKYMGIYQNRLLLGDDETWYISDAFQPDVFSTKATTGYIRLAKAGGGRNMGGIEFADQFVMFTEDQTWGVSNIDLDTYQLFPIALNVGCVAPDAAVAGDGFLTWPARNGWYAWDGNPKKPPFKITTEMDTTFGKLSYEGIGGSRATIHNGRMDVRLSNPDYTTIGVAWRFRFDTGKWNKITLAGFTSTLFPIATVYGPLGNNDAGYIHPVWGKVDYGTGAGTYSLFLGELTTQDNGTNYTCSGTMHFPLPASAVASPRRVLSYYQATDGWQTPVLSNAVTSQIGSAPGNINTGTADTADDYNVIGGTYASVSRATSDLKVTFSVASQAGGTVGAQRFFGAILEAGIAKFRRGAV